MLQLCLVPQEKNEIRRPQFSDETDLVITSRELAQMIKESKIDFKNLEESVRGHNLFRI